VIDRLVAAMPECFRRLATHRGNCFSFTRRMTAQGISTMNKLTQKLRRFLTSEDGPTAVEYAVMLALIVVVCLGAIQTIGTRANTTFTSVATALQGSSSSS
jgi:pilus assembly protein Flp/PilA